MLRRIQITFLSLLLLFSFTSCSPAVQSMSFGGTVECTTQIIRAKVAGRITKLLISEGIPIKKNIQIAQIQDNTLKLLLSQQKHLVKLKSAKIDELLNSKFDVADEIITQAREDKAMAQDSVKLAEINLANANVKTYLAGSVSEVYVSVGDDVAVGTAIAKISDLSHRFGYVYIPQDQLSKIKMGNEYEIRNSDISGKVIQIADAAEFTPKNTQTGDSKDNIVFKVKLEISGSKDLRPGMSFEINI